MERQGDEVFAHSAMKQEEQELTANSNNYEGDMTMDNPTTKLLDSSLASDTVVDETKLVDSSPRSGEVEKAKSFTDFAGHQLGGKVDKPAFCLLDGFVLEGDQGVQPFRVSIDRLPATLGRTHVTNEPNFFGLGKNVKALSRYQCRIDYRVPSGLLGQFASEDEEFTYRHTEKLKDLNNPTEASLPETGIYVITCLGKNPVKVNGLKIDQNETCVLPHGSRVKFSAFSVYFLLPSAPSTKSMEIPIKSKRKRKAQPESVTSSPPTKKSKIPAFKSMQDEIESMTTEALLAQLEIADEKNIWDRRCQFMGATVSYRAVRDAAQSVELQTSQATASAQAPGISKQEVVQWIADSERYGSWSEIMQRKLEPKSYQTNIAKAMQRAGYERSTSVSVGRHVRWYLPSELSPRDSTAQQISKASIKQEKADRSGSKSKGERENGGQNKNSGDDNHSGNHKTQNQESGESDEQDENDTNVDANEAHTQESSNNDDEMSRSQAEDSGE